MAKNVGVLVLVVWCAVHKLTQTAALECRGFPQFGGCGLLTKDFNGCVATQIMADIKIIKAGNKAINLASVDPLEVPYSKIIVRDGKHELVLQQCTLTGGGDTILTNLKFILPSPLDYDLEVPKFNLSCKRYKMSAGFLNAKANEGFFTLNMPNYKARFSLKGDSITQCNEQYTRALSSDSSFISASDFVAHFSGLGKQQLRKDSLKPLVTKALEKAQDQFTLDLLKQVQHFFQPVRVLFPNNTSTYVPFCLQPRPTPPKCSKGTN